MAIKYQSGTIATREAHLSRVISFCWILWYLYHTDPEYLELQNGLCGLTLLMRVGRI